MTPIFWYLISPYAELDHDYAQQCALDATQRLLHAGLRVYSPVVAERALEPLADPDYVTWARSAFLGLAKGAVVLTLPGWREDAQVKAEIAAFHAAKKPILEYANADNHGAADRPPVGHYESARPVTLYATPEVQTLRIPSDGDPDDVWIAGGVGFTGHRPAESGGHGDGGSGEAPSGGVARPAPLARRRRRGPKGAGKAA